ncbi:MAG: SEC-C metal-binding domain-containing protein, partial [Acidimicrobiales bacterium]
MLALRRGGCPKDRFGTAPDGKPGRNDPFPCGSGRKYKDYRLG